MGQFLDIVRKAVSKKHQEGSPRLQEFKQHHHGAAEATAHCPEPSGNLSFPAALPTPSNLPNCSDFSGPYQTDAWQWTAEISQDGYFTTCHKHQVEACPFCKFSTCPEICTKCGWIKVLRTFEIWRLSKTCPRRARFAHNDS